MKITKYLSLLILVFSVAACQPKTQYLVPEVINTYNHDHNAFTQGLLFANNKLYESTGLRGRSSLREVDLKTGKINEHYVYVASNFKALQNQIVLPNGMVIDLTKKALIVNNQLIPIKILAVTQYTHKGLVKKIIPLNSQGIDVIFMKSYHKILVMDDFFFNSSYIQMFVFDNYDKKLFKPVILNPMVKVYKVIK